MDGKPLIGERVVVLGQGIVGLLTTALLAGFPLEHLVTLDRYTLRRRASLELGVRASLDPGDAGTQDQLHRLLPDGADLCYELSGSPAALDQAIAITGFDGRVIIGSWYGQKRLSLDLGGRFHRSRIRLISSQVSTLAPELSGRWSKSRRFDLAWQMLARVGPARWITHRLPLHDAARAYQQIDQHPDQSIQVILTYP
jgi:threonine dehydrogenase-like Zn-dependent dehydrogenase